MTYFQFHIDLSPCGDSFSEIMVTNANKEVLEDIIKDIKKDNKLSIGKQKKVIPEILKNRGYSFETISQAVFTLKNPN